MALENLHEYLRQTGRYLLISGSNLEVSRVLENSGLLGQIGPENIFPAEANATLSTRKALKRAQELLPREPVTLRVFYDEKHLPPGNPPGGDPAPSAG